MVSEATADYVIVTLDVPGRTPRNVGILLIDPFTGRLRPKFRADWESLADPDEAEVLAHLEADFEEKSNELSGDELLAYFEDKLSNILRLSDRQQASVRNVDWALESLFEEHVSGGRAKAKIIPFRTHLPLYSLRAAATKFGEDMEVEEEDWIEAPQGLRLTEHLFVARVVGRSMEPLIPDGSLCIFRAGVAGSRQGKRLLIQQLGSSGSGGEFTVKKYSSRKKAGDDDWSHDSIRLEPLNPEFEAMEFGPEDEGLRFRVIGEFVRVL